MSEIFTPANLTAIATVILAALLHATVQLGLAALTLLYHESATRHVTKKTKSLISSFIAGTGIMIILLVGATCFIADRLIGIPICTEVLCAIAGVLIATSIIMFFLYYRKSGTELWIPKPIANFVHHRAKVTDNNTEAFSLGILCSISELPIIITPLVVATSSILSAPAYLQLLLVALYAIIAVLPPIIFRLSVHTGRTAIDIQKWRLKNKNFLRAISGFAFLILALFIITFQIIS